MSLGQRPTAHRCPGGCREQPCLALLLLPAAALPGWVQTRCRLLSPCECADMKQVGVSKFWNKNCVISLESSCSKICDVPRGFRWPFSPEIFCLCSYLKHPLCKQDHCSCLGREQDIVPNVLPREIFRCINLTYSPCRLVTQTSPFLR